MTKTPTLPYPPISDHQIRERARQLWLERGSPHGTDGVIWLEARRQLEAASTTATSPAHPGDAPAHFTIRSTVADHLSDPAHRFHAPGGSHDDRRDIVASEAPQRARGRRLGGSLRAQPKKAK